MTVSLKCRTFRLPAIDLRVPPRSLGRPCASAKADVSRSSHPGAICVPVGVHLGLDGDRNPTIRKL